MANPGRSRTTSGRARASSAAPSGVEALSGQAVEGLEWNPLLPEALAPGIEELNEPRPYTSRYPIPSEEFRVLKEAAPSAKLRKVTAERSEDPGENKIELSALPSAPAALSPGLPPVAAPSGAANFAGISATTWIPPDCTMAVGPNHVLLSVNSSVAVYDKAGSVALPPRTLTQWFSNVVQGMTIFDPKALYDQHEGRWVLL